MIKVIKNKNHIEIKGHAKFAKYGEDIVCAATSSIVITSINGILLIDDKAIQYKDSSGYISIDILKNDKTIDKLVKNMMNMLKELEEQYKKNIQVEEVE